MGEELYELPKGWVWISFSTVINKVKRGPSLKCNQEGIGIRYITSGNLADGKLNLNLDKKYLEGFEQTEKCKLKPGDLILNCVNSIEQIGKSAVFKDIHGEAIVGFNNYAIELKNEVVISEFINYFFQSVFAKKQIYFLIKRAVNQVSFATRELDFISVPLPPLSEQHRIVAKIEEIFTELDAGIELLKKLKVKLKRYRQAVLKAAVEGSLTKEWRKANQGKLEPASILRDRILKQRREKWEVEQLAKMKAQGKTPKDDSWKLKYKEPVVPDTSDLPELPDRWCWVTMEILTINGPQNGIYLPKSDYGSGIPILRIDDFQDNFSRSSSELNLVNATTDDIEKYSLSEGDLVINRVNSPSHLGKCLVVTDKHFPALFESNMMRLHLSNFFEVSFVAYYLRSVHGKSRLISNAKWAVNQASINQTDVGNTPVPLLPVEEQKKIIAEVELGLSVVEKIEKTIDANLKRAEKLRQSILKQAFEGKLVPQDPNDEPAEKLLERIKAEKAKHESEKKPKRQSKTKSSQPRKSQTTAIQLELNFDE